MRKPLFLLAVLASILYVIAASSQPHPAPRAETKRVFDRPRARSDRDLRQLIRRGGPEQSSSQRQLLFNESTPPPDQRPLSGLRGRVLEAAGQPVSGARIGLYRDEDSKLERVAITVDTGDFEAKDVQPGEVVAFSVSLDGRLALERVRLFAGQISQVTLVLEEIPRYELRGRVVDETGAGVGLVTVQAVSERSPPSDLDRLLAARFDRMQTWDQGDFYLPVGAPDWYRVQLREEPGGPVLLETRLFPDEAEEPTQLVIPRVKVVTCQLGDSQGRPLELQSYFMSYTKKGGGGGGGGNIAARQLRFLWRQSWDQLEITLYGEGQRASITLTSPEQPCLLTASFSAQPSTASK